MSLAPSSSRILINLGSSYANIVLMALITVLVVPFYVHALGAGQWGVVALCMTLQGLLFSIDVAFAPLMLRDVARAASHGQHGHVYQRFLRLYGGCAVSLFVVAQLLVTVLRDPPTSFATPISDDLAWALRIVLVQFLFQFSNNAAIGYWYGLERQRFANRRVAAFMLVKHTLALLLVTLWSSSAVAYLLPFALIGAIEFFVNARRVRHEHAVVPAVSPDVPAFEGWRNIAEFSVAAGIGVLTTQIDRIFLALTLPAEKYGVYFLASNLMLSLLSLQVPIHRAFLPRMATAPSPQLVADAMRQMSILLLVIPCLAGALFPQTVLRLWLHDAAIADVAAPTLRLMLIAIAMIALYASTATRLLTEQRYRTIALVNGLVLLAQLAVLIVLTPRVGMIAGGFAWLACGTVQALFAALLWRAGNERASPAEAAR